MVNRIPVRGIRKSSDQDTSPRPPPVKYHPDQDWPGHNVLACVAMTGRKSGIVAPVKQVAPHIASTHRMIHREALAAKDMNEDLAYVFSTCVKIVNSIKARPPNHRLFENVPRNGSRTQAFVATYRSEMAVTRSRCAACL